ncbi:MULTISPECIES: SGNH/GDSL hydrolase family protein [Roseivirga]|uniref:SGNH/GDSL hydrolase family protein n=1 Tax=Roseivirga TaxID=290180 RepID=UPI000A9A00B2|nr:MULTISPECIES: SGNH/GDSL hydrolase family protein [Roseivirga]MBO6662747.1 SGNH/GDSL hydrolase family protein [Roseivirga sp.]MBO6761263.1 SGNH/GDSL hydrolase family protein [Roseivirga sp.]MBO6909875.1 SGNH/GDSL hydrolase family protein [Roseivirga sp.]WPZ10642.1 SGNH/GDSL hydrolase family protein [Roseivirga spongicola]
MKRLQPTLILLSFIMFIQAAQAQDWANLKKYQQQNSQLTPLTQGEKSVVFMGNSITEGWKNIRPEFFEGKPYVNRGISGQTTPQMLIRFTQDVIDLRPEAVVILAGINDIAGNTGPTTQKMITDNIFAMAKLAKAHNIKVLLCSVLPANDFPWRPGLEPAQKVIDLNDELKAFAKEHKITYVDYFSAMVNEQNGLKAELGSDGVHPNTAGYLVMEPILEKALDKTLKR